MRNSRSVWSKRRAAAGCRPAAPHTLRRLAIGGQEELERIEVTELTIIYAVRRPTALVTALLPQRERELNEEWSYRYPDLAELR